MLFLYADLIQRAPLLAGIKGIGIRNSKVPSWQTHRIDQNILYGDFLNVKCPGSTYGLQQILLKPTYV